jgi:glycerol-3-phosphate acyltransferase PlsX
MRIAVDAMGGDHAPAEIVRGAVQGSRLHGVDVVLVGDSDRIARFLPSHTPPEGVSVHHASEVIEMGDHVDAVRTKKDASVVVAAALVREGKADAMVSVGNTAAAMAVATLKLGRIRGIDRPAIATVMPSKTGATIMLDAGAVVDCTPEMLVQFAVMGSVYAEKALGVGNPRVGLLSIGEEKSKGNELTRAAHELLLATGCTNFIGNVEGRDLFSGNADVIVADGFVGNVALKTAEGLIDLVKSAIKGAGKSDPLAWIGGILMLPGLALAMPFVKRLKKSLDYTEHGGAPLLGIDGVCIIGHGRSNARAVSSAVRAAKEAVSGGVVEAIRDRVARSVEPAAVPVTEDRM